MWLQFFLETHTFIAFKDTQDAWFSSYFIILLSKSPLMAPFLLYQTSRHCGAPDIFFFWAHSLDNQSSHMTVITTYA